MNTIILFYLFSILYITVHSVRFTQRKRFLFKNPNNNNVHLTDNSINKNIMNKNDEYDKNDE